MLQPKTTTYCQIGYILPGNSAILVLLTPHSVDYSLPKAYHLFLCSDTGYCHNPGQSKAELSNLEWCYYHKTPPPHVPLQYRAIPYILQQSRAEQSRVV